MAKTNDERVKLMTCAIRSFVKSGQVAVNFFKTKVYKKLTFILLKSLQQMTTCVSVYDKNNKKWNVTYALILNQKQ